MPVSRRTRAEHDKRIFNVQKLISGVGFWPNTTFAVANLAPSTVTIQTGDFSNVHNFVKILFGTQFKAHIVANRAVRHLRLKSSEITKTIKKKSFRLCCVVPHYHSPPTIRSRENKELLFYRPAGKKECKNSKYKSQYIFQK
jgi:hypothetical protein